MLAVPVLDVSLGGGSAFAQTASEEKQAFEAAKELGTVDAWNAFLANYSSGFHADLARAYLKKLSEEANAPPAPPPQAYQPAPPVANEFPLAAGSWGGIVRSGPGQDYRKVTTLDEGDAVTLLERTGVVWNGYPWFRISYRNGKRGYQWGGILCAKGAARGDVHETCRTKPVKKVTKKKPRKRGCGSGRIKVDGKCIRKSQAASYCGPGYTVRRGKCVFRHAQPQRPKCPPGQVWSPQELCHYDD